MITLISPYVVRWMLGVDPIYYPLYLVVRLTLPIILPIFVPECPLAMERKICKMVSRHVISMYIGTVTDTTTVKSTGQPYSAAAHHTLIAMWCAKNHCPFNSVLDEDYQTEVEMLRPGTILPGPQTVSRDIKSIYAEMSKNVRNYFMVTYILF